jgi:hypothetical protein
MMLIMVKKQVNYRFQHRPIRPLHAAQGPALILEAERTQELIR